MKTIQVTLLVEDSELEERITQLEERCKKINVPLESILQTTATTMPNKPFVDILLSLSDLKISDMESAERTKKLFGKIKPIKMEKEK